MAWVPTARDSAYPGRTPIISSDCKWLQDSSKTAANHRSENHADCTMAVNIEQDAHLIPSDSPPGEGSANASRGRGGHAQEGP
jgi:hypothetical protein